MIEEDLIVHLAEVLDPSSKGWYGLRKGDRLLLALPMVQEASSQALGLYQPQRFLAKSMVGLLEILLKIRCAGLLLPKIKHPKRDHVLATPALEGIDHGTCGVLLGSPEHKVRRAIASYRKNSEWEVAKVSIGEAGRFNLEREASVLAKLYGKANGVPPLLGIHYFKDLTLLRMPYLTGQPVKYGQIDEALSLLESWLDHSPHQGIDTFSEWDAISKVLGNIAHGDKALDKLSRERLCPVICHGDFARWNLRMTNNGLLALDWEWGQLHGMPGLDLVHYFLQDARLVDKLSPVEAVRKAILAMESQRCADYFKWTGWSENPVLPIIASLAFKEGAAHQDNIQVLEAALILMNENLSK
jgi:hypothetical protein